MSRPTPVVPATEELRALGARSHPPDVGSLAPNPSSRPTDSFPAARSVEGEAPTISIRPTEDEAPSFSDRPTLAEAPRFSEQPTNGEAPRTSQRPTDPARPERQAENAFFDSAPSRAGQSVEPPLSLPPRRRPRSRARSVFAKILFVTMFAGVATLLGLAIKTKLDAGVRPSLPSALTR